MKPLNAKDVLVVDDDEAIRSLIALVLTRLGMSCDTAVDGTDALGRIATTRYAVILVDLMMPRLSGEEFVSALRGHERASRERPVVLMMTALSVHDRFPELGDDVQAVIRKPFDVAQLAELVYGCVEGRRLHETGPVIAARVPRSRTVNAGDDRSGSTADGSR